MLRAWAKDFAQATKLRLSSTVVFSAALAYFIAADRVDVLVLGYVLLGGFATTMAANLLNQVIERDYDRQMQRTQDRPLAQQRMSVPQGVLLAGLLSILGTLSLAAVGTEAMLLGVLALLSYAFVYTPLKRYSVVAVFVGTVPGAIPVLIGAVAAEGTLTSLGWSLFAIQMLWQIPHFWAIGWLAFDDYRKAGFRLLPTNALGERDPGTGLQALVCGLLLAGLVFWPYLLGAFSLVATAASSVLGLVYAYFGWRLYRQADRTSALRLMFFSLAYLPLVLILGWLA